MQGMFFGCIAMEEIDLSSFTLSNKTDVYGMFSGCSKFLKMKIREKYNIFKKEAFYEIKF